MPGRPLGGFEERDFFLVGLPLVGLPVLSYVCCSRDLIRYLQRLWTLRRFDNNKTLTQLTRSATSGLLDCDLTMNFPFLSKLRSDSEALVVVRCLLAASGTMTRFSLCNCSG